MLLCGNAENSLSLVESSGLPMCAHLKLGSSNYTDDFIFF